MKKTHGSNILLKKILKIKEFHKLKLGLSKTLEKDYYI